MPFLWLWVRGRIPGFEIPGPSFASGSWIARLGELLDSPPPPSQPGGGAEQVADRLLERVAAFGE